MRPLFCAFSAIALLALAGCADNQASSYQQGPMLGATPAATDDTLPPDQNVASLPPPSQAVSTGVSNLDISAFADPAGFRAMDATSQAQASSAQYYALQFGRVGAARTWTGDNNVTGSVNVGPFVKVNNRDCRDFTNIVNVGSKSYTKRGTACRGDDGQWAVGIANAMAPAAASGIGAAG